METLSVNTVVENWNNTVGKGKIKEFVIDSDGIFTTDKGFAKGVYLASIVTPYKQIPMYIGEVGKMDRCFRDRMVEHLRYWIEKPLFYTGISPEELDSGYKYKIEVLAIEADDAKRYEMEQAFIEEIKPYTQFNCYPKFDSEYNGNDLAIFNTYRRRAFLVARDGKYTEKTSEITVNDILNMSVDFGEYRNAHPDKNVIDTVQNIIPKDSDSYMKVKKFIEKELGIVSKRGCIYSYVVKLVAAALQAES